MLTKTSLLASIYLLLTTVSCHRAGTDRILDEAERLLNRDPERALSILDSIVQDEMPGRKYKARFALLHSAALDKNNIDILNDSIIAPAARWYRRHGTAEEKLKTWYYLGRIRQNAGDPDAAMECFAKAERHVGHAKDRLQTGMLYSAKAFIYEQLYCIEEAMANTVTASENYLAAKDTSRYVNAVLNICYDCLSIEDYENAEKWLSAIWPRMEDMTDAQKSGCYVVALHTVHSKGKDTGPLITEYLESIRDSSEINWIELAYAYENAGDYEKGIEALECHRKTDPGFADDPAYLVVNSSLNERTGQYEEALKSYKEYIRITDNTDMDIFESNAKYAEDREIARHRISVRELWLAILALGMATLILGTSLFFSRLHERNRKRQEEKEKIEKEKAVLEQEKDNYMKLYRHALNEKRHLQRISNETGLDREIRQSIEERLNILNKFITAALSKNLVSSASDTLKEFMDDRDRFLHSTKISFIIMHPQFISFLKNSGLTEWEIGCCCLYCIGLNGNEIAVYLKRKSFYNASSVIRKKLGLEKHGINLDNFLKGKMQELD